MARVFDGKLDVGYHTASLAAPGGCTGAMPDMAFRGQTNGLCGAAVPGVLLFTTGLHHGGVGFSMDVLDAAPPIDDAWEEIVEVSFCKAQEGEMDLCDFYEIDVQKVALAPGVYRVRYCGRDMNKGSQEDTLVDEDPVDAYSLTFWPAPPAPDAILKQTSEFAAYWHSYAQGKPI